MAIGQELLNVPMGDMIRQMAFAIAEAQVKLDKASIDVAEMMGGLTTVHDENGKVTFDDSRVFFGYEYMTKLDALAYIEIDNALTGGSNEALVEAINNQPDKQADGGDGLVRVPTRSSMLELGFVPTFYQFVDTIIEVKIAIKITREVSVGRKSSQTDTATQKRNRSFGAKFAGLRFRSSGESTNVSTSQVDATYAAKYSYSAEGSSLLRTKLAPLPPPPILEERIRAILEGEKARRDKLFAKEEDD